MKFLLVNPACQDLRVTDNDSQMVPIGLYYLAAQLMDHGHTAPILNLAGQDAAAAAREQEKGADPQPGPGPDQPVSLASLTRLFARVAAREKPDVIGFSVTNPARRCAMACARAARTVLPHALILFGGPAPTFMAPHLFKACPELDIAVRGEGELTLLALAQLLDRHPWPAPSPETPEKTPPELPGLSQIKGLVFRRGNSLADTGLPDPVPDLDRLAHPSEYFAFQHLAMSRGCPGRCTFCGSPKFWGTGQVRFHSPQWFFEEIQALVRKGVTHFYISDDTFTMDRERVTALCEKIISAGLSITWNAISRVDYVDADLMAVMRRAGCIQISFGVESGSDRIRKVLGKPMDDEACVRAFDLARSHGILPRAYFIYGAPKETEQTIDRSLALMERLAPLGTVFYMLVLFPGTHLYNRARTKGQVSDDIWFQPIEDLPWFELDPDLDFQTVKAFGDRLREKFYSALPDFVDRIDLVPDKALFPFHADFLSRLAMTFSAGEYARDPRIPHAEAIAQKLFERALAFGRDPRAYMGLAMILQKQKKPDRAAALLETGLAHFPENRDLGICMGVCLMNLGEFKKALAQFSRFDNAPDIRHYISICQARLTRQG